MKLYFIMELKGAGVYLKVCSCCVILVWCKEVTQWNGLKDSIKRLITLKNI